MAAEPKQPESGLVESIDQLENLIKTRFRGSNYKGYYPVRKEMKHLLHSMNSSNPIEIRNLSLRNFHRIVRLAYSSPWESCLGDSFLKFIRTKTSDLASVGVSRLDIELSGSDLLRELWELNSIINTIRTSNLKHKVDGRFSQDLTVAIEKTFFSLRSVQKEQWIKDSIMPFEILPLSVHLLSTLRIGHQESLIELISGVLSDNFNPEQIAFAAMDARKLAPEGDHRFIDQITASAISLIEKQEHTPAEISHSTPDQPKGPAEEVQTQDDESDINQHPLQCKTEDLMAAIGKITQICENGSATSRDLSAMLTRIERSLTDISDDKVSMLGKIDELRTVVASVEAKLSAKNKAQKETRVSLEKSLQDIEPQIKKLAECYTNLEAGRTAMPLEPLYMGQPNVGDKRLNLDLEAGTKQSQGNLGHACEKPDDLPVKKTDIERDLFHARAEIIQMKGDICELKVTETQLEIELNSKHWEASKSECMLADTKIEKKELEARAAKLKGNKAAVKAELAHEKQAHQETRDLVQRDKDDWLKRIWTLQKSVDEIQREKETHEDLLNEVQALLADAESSKQIKARKIKELKSDVGSLTTELAGNKKVYREVLERSQADARAWQIKNEELQVHLKQMQFDNEATQTTLATLNAEKDNLEAALEAEQAAYQHTEEDLAKLRQDSLGHQARIADLEALQKSNVHLTAVTIPELQSDLMKAKTGLKDQMAKTAKLESEKAELDKQYLAEADAHERASKNYHEGLGELDELSTDHCGEKSNLSVNISTLTTENRDLIDRVSQIEKEKDSLNKDLQAANDKIDELTNQIQNACSSVDGASSTEENEAQVPSHAADNLAMNLVTVHSDSVHHTPSESIASVNANIPPDCTYNLNDCTENVHATINDILPLKESWDLIKETTQESPNTAANLETATSHAHSISKPSMQAESSSIRPGPNSEDHDPDTWAEGALTPPPSDGSDWELA